ncbi:MULTISPECIES: TetR/AcrR family transcriptional regulator [Frankia]|uniref:TetR family transcriptional regulatory protein n=1 Tax=Frankia alni (strain DSM 45986 / CECT 9034 / ACN14a) TaxID=326424 RepID=Q0RIR7_FRAAA|nr:MULTISPECIES: TetR/AcrR family transcriptional regulator [Frankia]CAJ62599.1 putative tetR family transcriptional regulatory protein [Frankia alni ACN14a]
MPTETRGSSRPLRSDARRNREALLAAARTVFAARGVDAPLEAVAQHAGFAIGTLYRHFPTRDALLDVIVDEKLRAWVEFGEQAVARDDAWEGLVAYLEGICALQAVDRAFNDVACGAVLAADGSAPQRRRVADLVDQMLARARQAGVLRADFTVTDLALLVLANAGVAESTRSLRPTLWRRHLALALDALRPAAAHPLTEPPATPTELQRALVDPATAGPRRR